MESLEISKGVVYFNGESAIRLPVSSVADQLNLPGLGIGQRPSEFIARLDRRAWPSFDESMIKWVFNCDGSTVSKKRMRLPRKILINAPLLVGK